MKNNFLETIVGAFVLIIAGVFFIFGYKNSYTNVANSTIITASFTKIDGINVGDNVRIGGVNIGKVDKINIDKTNFKIKLFFKIDASIKIPEDSSAEIVSESLMGGKFVNITPGDSDIYLKNNENIDITQSSLSLESLLSKYLFAQK